MTAATVAPPLRRLPVPVVEPEPAVGPWVPAPAPPAYAVQGTLALAFAAGGPAPLALVDPEFAPRPTPSSALPDAERPHRAGARSRGGARGHPAGVPARPLDHVEVTAR